MTSLLSQLLDKGTRLVERLNPRLETSGTKLRDIREKRKRFLESLEEREMSPPIYNQKTIEVLVDMALQEAELRPNFEPDLLIVTEEQFKSMFDIPASVPVNSDKWENYFEPITGRGSESHRQSVLPPVSYSVDAGEIDVVYSSNAERMILVESGRL